ncbi:hypothetical protein [Paenibacillus sedimenti]|uniref:Uncharacterized protein n=1 Tax=Paenibacillus sedimenti TaxID=2770274 RepID=A0A926KPS6_9BACL|nr:hypothetical protein [Paenibacillus sedimenti]MBD0381078.1 hypothetical protein [Paenibacillus sedimenti]
MTKKYKPLTKKEKAVAAVVTSALVAAPFLISNSYDTVVHASSSASPGSETLDKIGNMVIPLNQSAILFDLKSVYGAGSGGFYVTSSNAGTAFSEPDYTEKGLLKIRPLNAGTATFNVLINKDGYYYVDTFEITVDSALSSSRRFDIADTVKRLVNNPNDYADSSKVKKLLANIGSAKLPGTIEGNHAPTVDSENPFTNRELNKEETINIGKIESFFKDQDGDPLEVIPVANNAFISLIKGSDDNWYLKANGGGDNTQFTLIARDGRGGFVESRTFIVTVKNQKPELKGSNPFSNLNMAVGSQSQLEVDSDLTNYFTDPDFDSITVSFEQNDFVSIWQDGENWYIQATENINSAELTTVVNVTVNDGWGGVLNVPFNVRIYDEFYGENQPPELVNIPFTDYLSKDAIIDLNNYFIDSDEDILHYSIKVMNSNNVVSLEPIGLEGSFLTTNDIPFLGAIREIIASDGESETKVDVEIRRSHANPFPQIQTLYLGSSYIFDLNHVFSSNINFNDTKILVSDSENSESVTASVYEDHYLKLNANQLTSELVVKLLAHDTEVDKWYQDDFILESIPMDDELGIHLPTLYPGSTGDGLWYIYEHTTVEPSDTGAFLTYASGDYVKLQTQSEGTYTVTIDPDHGERVFYIKINR